ncbi:response regulator [Rhizobium sp. L1K21]|uniref:response regulator n=1 Tax=Rhizobium sp. L1K21 TaxID=2954933 RepID=UPI0020939576|nr:response regulator [Rhizobium sp. L1K21]MCO6187482.1 response regulator [Rhizobium sp. L1K21]
MTQAFDGKIRVLLIDDDPAEFEMISMQADRLAEGARIHIDYAMSIEAAIAKLAEGAYQLVLLDNMLLPNKDFRETVPQLRKARYTGPIGIISNDISDAFFQEIERYGADFRMSKQELDADSLEYVFLEFTRDNSAPL